MPNKPKRLCPVSGCSGLYDPNISECSKCGKRERTGWDRDKQRGTRQERGYGQDWVNLTQIKLGRDPLCEPCLRNEYTTEATQVHHIVPFRGLDDPLRLDWDNLESICETCHVRLSAKEGRRKRG